MSAIRGIEANAGRGRNDALDPNRPSEPNLFDHVVSDGKELRRQFDTERQPNL
jgi:hypothetical protein